MNREKIYEFLKERKLQIAVILGIIFLIFCLAISYKYFGLRDFDHSKFMHFAENMANGIQDRNSFQQWFLATQDSLENWLKEEIKAGNNV